MVALVGLFGLALSHRRFTGFLVAYAFYYIAAPLVLSNYGHLATLYNIHLLTLPFVIGMALFQFRQHVPLQFPDARGAGLGNVLRKSVVPRVVCRDLVLRCLLSWFFAIRTIARLQPTR